MKDHHRSQEQLSLDLRPAVPSAIDQASAPPATATAVPSAVVYRFPEVRATAAQNNTARLHAQIIESIKHIG